tara:strand:- start:87 stop:299 length:213 start_codon:yes stop_codon:yes gene_type:complete
MAYINKTKNANPNRSKKIKLKIIKAKPMSSTAPRREAFQEVIIPPKTAYKFKEKDVFETTTKQTKGKKKK